MKQNFLEKNNLFNPTKYFGGLVISDLANYSPDKRLEEMFDEYLPTEEDVCNEEDKNAMSNSQKIPGGQNCQSKNNSKSNPKAFFGKKNNMTCSKSFQLSKDMNTLKPSENNKKVNQLLAQTSAEKLKFLFKDNINEKNPNNFKKNTSLLNSKGSINLSTNDTHTEKYIESSRIVESSNNQKLGYHKPPKSKMNENKTTNGKNLTEGINKLKNEKIIPSKLLGSSLSPRNISINNKLTKLKGREETQSAERKIENERNKRTKDKNFFSFTQNTLPDEEGDSNYNIINQDYPRPKTANPSFIEEATPLIKSILSPKFCKTPQIETNKSLGSSIKQDDKKILTTNPLKFFNDFLNKSKHSNINSSNHIKMPKKYTFTESKQNESNNNSNYGNKLKQDKEKTLVKTNIQVNNSNIHGCFSNISSAKRLFGSKYCK